jgi:predicted ATPase
MLLVIDNVEHVLEAAGLVSRILVSSPAIRVIATSRVKLSITGEAVLRLGGFSHEWRDLGEALDTSGVALFVDAARRADASFELGEDDLAALSRILDLVAGLPLGILLAASWVDALTVPEIAEEISRSMDFLETDLGDVTTRHRSMRAVFDYSWSLLEGPERDRLAALSVFRGGFARDAAGAVAGASFRDLTRLEAKSLITLDRDAGRYAVHELIRQYAGEQLHGALSETVLAAHTEFFATMSEEAVADFFSGRDQAGVFVTFEAEYQNARAALRRSLAERDAASTRRLALGLQFLMDIRGWLRAAHELMDDVAEVFAEDSTDDTERVVGVLARIQMARLGMNLGIAGDAQAGVADGVELLRRLDDGEALAVALEALAEVMTYAGDSAAVRAAAHEVIAMTSADGSDLWPAAMHNYLAVASLLEERPDEAMATLLEGDRVLARHGEAYMRTWNLEMQAAIQLMMGNAEDAIATRLQQVELAASVGYARSLGLGRGGLGEAYRKVGRLDEAAECLHDALEIFDRLGMAVEKSIVLVGVALTRAARGQAVSAVEILSSVSVNRTADSPHPMTGERLGDIVDRSLAAVRATTLPADYEAAAAAGEAKGFDIVVKELLEGYDEAD